MNTPRCRGSTRYLIVLAQGTAGWGILALELLTRHPLTGVVGGRQWPGGVGGRVLPLLVGELPVGSVLLPTIILLDEFIRSFIDGRQRDTVDGCSLNPPCPVPLREQLT